ncbi:phosphoglycerate mutase-like protein [Phlebopus sp. FC_14]|nr:phosphoglycerate mutase-like protein [Phlebopus sp. FC_14]
MYIPSFLNLLQIHFSQLEPAHSEFGVDRHQPSNRNHFNNLGTLSPYHSGPHVPEVSLNLPSDCTVDQVMLVSCFTRLSNPMKCLTFCSVEPKLHRHGSRGPEYEKGTIAQLADTLDHARDVIQKANLPPNLRFLKEGYEYRLVPEALTIIGRQQLFDHGVEFALRYPTFSTDRVISSPVQRVVDSSHYFAQAFFGREVDNVTFLTVDDLDDPVSWITPWKFCPKYSEEPYRKTSSILSIGDIHGALYACPYDLAARNASPWCNVFLPHELRALEYEYDVLMDGVSGHAGRGDPGPVLGAFYIQKLIERFTNATGDAKSLYLEFGHDTSILLPLSTMGLNKDDAPLTPYHMRSHRRFRTSEQVPFAANMIWEKFTCKNSFKGPQIRLLLNEEPLPLSICQRSGKDRRFGSCALAEFVKSNEFSTSISYGGEIWNATCEHDV